MNKLNFKALISERNGNVSLGRVSYWVTFGIIIFMWLSQWPVQSSLEIVFLTLCTYNLGTKVNETIQAHIKSKGMKSDEGNN